MFVARPGVTVERQSSPHWHIGFGERDDPTPLEDLRAVCNRDDLMAKISAKLGIGITMFPRQDGSYDRRHLSLRSALIYCFQKQNEIANPDLFFHRQSDPGIAQTIHDTLPYYLGAISEDIIARQQELKTKRKRLRDVQKSIERMSEIGVGQDDETAYLLNEARRAGLLREDEAIASDDDRGDKALELLRRAEAASRNPVDGPGEDVLAILDKRLFASLERRSDLKREIALLKEFGKDQDLVFGGINEQRRRLHSLHLIPNAQGPSDLCPICQSVMSSPTPVAQEMIRSLRVLDQELTFVSRDQTELTEAVAKQKVLLSETENEIASVRRQITRLRDEEERTRAQLERRNDGARVGGMIQMFLRVAGAPGDDRSALEAEAAALMEAIEELEEETDFTSLKTRTATFLAIVGQNITTWARQQSLGYASGLLTFDIRGPQLVSETEAATIPFSRFGSGKNWVWYHLLGHMALHKWFSEKQRPTPRFLVVDQPSQVYFPAGSAEEGQTDLDEVQRIYKWLFAITAEFDGDMQVIIMDHARFPENQEFVDHIEHDWWKGEGSLIPRDWQRGA